MGMDLFQKLNIFIYAQLRNIKIFADPQVIMHFFPQFFWRWIDPTIAWVLFPDTILNPETNFVDNPNFWTKFPLTIIDKIPCKGLHSECN